MSISAAQCRAARALIGWSQEMLSAASMVAKATIAQFEASNRTPYNRTLDALRVALELGGVEFIHEDEVSGVGVRLRKKSTNA